MVANQNRKINLHALRRAIDVIFDDIARNEQISEVGLESDYYWQIPNDRLYELKQPPPTATEVGQLTADWEFVSAMLAEGQGSRAMLCHVAPLLHYLSTLPYGAKSSVR